MEVRLRSYQQQASDWLARKRRALLIAPAGSGKTFIISAAIRSVVLAKARDRKPVVLWLANTREQVEQAKQALDTWCLDKIEADVRCVAGAADWTGAADLIVFDECHHLRSAKSWQAVAAKHAGPLWCCSATPWGQDHEENSALSKLVEGNIYEVARADAATSLAPLASVGWVEFAAKPGIKSEIEAYVAARAKPWMSSEQLGKLTWTAVRTIGIDQHQERTDALWSKAMEHRDEPCLVLVSSIAQGQYLERRSNARLVTSATRNRSGILKDYAKERFNVLIATSLADEGLDLPRARVLINMAGGRSEARTEQRAGRVMRLAEGKESGLVYDSLDGWHRLARAHSLVRARVYERLMPQQK